MTDPIADMITRIRNANIVRKEKVDIPASKLKSRISLVLKREKFIKSYKFIEDRKQGILRIYLKYGENKERYIIGLKRVSKPGCRKYVDKEAIPWVYGGAGIAIVSTSSGVMTDKECRKLKIGGEVLCYVW